MAAYYNEFEPFAAEWLKNLIKQGLIADGEVDNRSIADVRPDDLKGFTQCHFFAGIGGWSRALRLAGWSDERPVWTGSCPCQPFSQAGKRKGVEDARHLWPVWFNLIRGGGRLPVIFGEQVSSAISHGWVDGVRSDLEAEGYAFGSAVLPACSVDAPHKRDRLWFVAHAPDQGLQVGRSGQVAQPRQKPEPERRCEDGYGNVGDTEHNGLHGCQVAGRHAETVQRSQEGTYSPSEPSGTDTPGELPSSPVVVPQVSGSDQNQDTAWGGATNGNQEFPKLIRPGGVTDSFWSTDQWVVCGDGKARRIPSTKSGICLLANGIPGRVGQIRAGGNAIVPQVAAGFIVAADHAIRDYRGIT